MWGSRDHSSGTRGTVSAGVSNTGSVLLSDPSEEQKSSLHVGFVSASMLQSKDHGWGAGNPPLTASSDTGFLHILQQITSPLCICGAGMKLLMSEHHNLGDKG